jgi:hypothetical protein
VCLQFDPVKPELRVFRKGRGLDIQIDPLWSFSFFSRRLTF